jgi:hypothetical protein
MRGMPREQRAIFSFGHDHSQQIMSYLKERVCLVLGRRFPCGRRNRRSSNVSLRWHSRVPSGSKRSECSCKRNNSELLLRQLLLPLFADAYHLIMQTRLSIGNSTGPRSMLIHSAQPRLCSASQCHHCRTEAAKRCLVIGDRKIYLVKSCQRFVFRGQWRRA